MPSLDGFGNPAIDPSLGSYNQNGFVDANGGNGLSMGNGMDSFHAANGQL
jgi:hypothetical protein